ncbi:MAG: hypothetical protein Ct9H300mP13_7620 [Gammaproteobacteria bacterium]|nr:MAG: hypothetical protein Ct9H300mP13_7620 [Gammaproteobacteria bacterium]
MTLVAKTQVKINITEQEWQSVAGWFHPRATTAEAERHQIRQAIGWMEVVVGRYTPTYRDKALNLEYGGKSPGQMDCIDESLNVTQYLSLFESRGLLRWHRVVERAYRRALLMIIGRAKLNPLRTQHAMSSMAGSRTMVTCLSSKRLRAGVTYRYLGNLPTHLTNTVSLGLATFSR